MFLLDLVGIDSTPELVVGPKFDSFSFFIGLISGFATIFIVWLFKMFITTIIDEFKKDKEKNNTKSDE